MSYRVVVVNLPLMFFIITLLGIIAYLVGIIVGFNSVPVNYTCEYYPAEYEKESYKSYHCDSDDPECIEFIPITKMEFKNEEIN